MGPTNYREMLAQTARADGFTLPDFSPEVRWLGGEVRIGLGGGPKAKGRKGD